MAKIIQDRSKCIGCLACVGLCPEHFAADPDTGLAKLIDAQGDEPVLTKEVNADDASLDILPGACCGGAISVEK